MLPKNASKVGPRFPQVVVLVGATGDLARRKLLPGLFHLVQAGFIPGCRIIGVSLDDLDADGFRKFAREALDEFSTRKVSEADWAAFAADPRLRAAVRRRRRPQGSGRGGGAVARRREPPPALPERAAQRGPVGGAAAGRGRPGRALPHHHGEAVRHRSASAVSLNAKLHEVFAEEQIFRIDHFLGKEAAQNILAFRFANGLFEPIWNRNFIDHVQIDVPETLGLGKRAGFYEATGAFRDMVVTHLFQILAFMAMEPPTALEPAPISEEKNKVFRSMSADRAHGRRARAVHRLPRGGGRRPRIGHRDLHRAEVRDRQLALGRRAVLPAHRQAAGRGPADHLASPSASRPRACSRPARASARRARTT